MATAVLSPTIRSIFAIQSFLSACSAVRDTVLYPLTSCFVSLGIPVRFYPETKHYTNGSRRYVPFPVSALTVVRRIPVTCQQHRSRSLPLQLPQGNSHNTLLFLSRHHPTRLPGVLATCCFESCSSCTILNHR
ncbi:hypothetical protein BJV78DRAFT_202376 [Lactifluus subvellereus]|nr:hypothetical protein BJV78DRAFT_202376 [Lactifluus subvellereus]